MELLRSGLQQRQQIEGSDAQASREAAATSPTTRRSSLVVSSPQRLQSGGAQRVASGVSVISAAFGERAASSTGTEAHARRRTKVQSGITREECSAPQCPSVQPPHERGVQVQQGVHVSPLRTTSPHPSQGFVFCSGNCSASQAIADYQHELLGRRMGRNLRSVFTRCDAPLPLGRKYITVKLLTNQTLYFAVELKCTVQDIFDQLCCYLGIVDSQLFGLARQVQPGSGLDCVPEFCFVEQGARLAKLAPKSWKEATSAGLDGHGRPLITLYLRVQYFLDCLVFLQQDRVACHHYYQQVKTNLLRYDWAMSQEKAFMLASLALQADLGNYDPVKHRGKYFEPANYFTWNIVQTVGEAFIVANLPLMHRDHHNLNRGTAQLAFIRESQEFALHVYRVQQKKSNYDFTLVGVSPLGLQVYQPIAVSVLATQSCNVVMTKETLFPWSDISKLTFDRRRFEVRLEGRCRQLLKFVYVCPSEAMACALLELCKRTHQFNMAIQPRLTELRKMERRNRVTKYRESYICDPEEARSGSGGGGGGGGSSNSTSGARTPVKDLLASGTLSSNVSRHSSPALTGSDPRISVISSSSSNTTSGVMSDKPQSPESEEDDDDDDEDDVDHRLPVAPALSLESLHLSHLNRNNSSNDKSNNNNNNNISSSSRRNNNSNTNQNNDDDDDSNNNNKNNSSGSSSSSKNNNTEEYDDDNNNKELGGCSDYGTLENLNKKALSEYNLSYHNKLLLSKDVTVGGNRGLGSPSSQDRIRSSYEAVDGRDGAYVTYLASTDAINTSTSLLKAVPETSTLDKAISLDNIALANASLYHHKPQTDLRIAVSYVDAMKATSEEYLSDSCTPQKATPLFLKNSATARLRGAPQPATRSTSFAGHQKPRPPPVKPRTKIGISSLSRSPNSSKVLSEPELQHLAKSQSDLAVHRFSTAPSTSVGTSSDSLDSRDVLDEVRLKSSQHNLPFMSALCQDRSLMPKTVPNLRQNPAAGHNDNRRFSYCSYLLAESPRTPPVVSGSLFKYTSLGNMALHAASVSPTAQQPQQQQQQLQLQQQQQQQQLQQEQQQLQQQLLPPLSHPPLSLAQLLPTPSSVGIPHPSTAPRQMIPHKLSQENNPAVTQLAHRKAVVF